MAAEARHLPERAERGLDAVECVAQATPAEIARRHDRQ
jgi:hypothetical protein